MRTKNAFRCKAAATIFAMLLPFVPVHGQDAAVPEYVIKDQNDVVLGGLSGVSTSGQTVVLMHDDASGENYHIQVSADVLRGADTSDVFFTNADCTGTAYVFAPSVLSSLPEMRRSVYSVGPAATGDTSCCQIFRGAGAESNKDGDINSRFRANLVSGYTCTGVDPGVNVVEATAVEDLSSLVFPLKAE